MITRIVFFCFLFISTIFSFSDKKIENEKKKMRNEVCKYFPAEFIDLIFNNEKFGIDSEIVRIIKHPRSADFSFMFTEESIMRGKNYLASYKKTLDTVSGFYGPSQSILVAIMRIESDFGSNLGEFFVVNALFTQYAHSRNKKSMVSNLKCFLKTCYKFQIDPFSVKGSWAGAVGLPQFMPYSFVFLVDGDKDGVINITWNHIDALFSIGNFFKENGWNSKKLEKSIMKYNKSKRYAKTVIKYAKLIE